MPSPIFPPPMLSASACALRASMTRQVFEGDSFKPLGEVLQIVTRHVGPVQCSVTATTSDRHVSVRLWLGTGRERTTATTITGVGMKDDSILVGTVWNLVLTLVEQDDLFAQAAAAYQPTEVFPLSPKAEPMPPNTKKSIEDLIEAWFTYHSPTDEQQAKLVAVRAGAKAFALILVGNTPMCADQSAAFRLLRECVGTANASIVLEPYV